MKALSLPTNHSTHSPLPKGGTQYDMMDDYQIRTSAIGLIKQLVHLCRDTQSHRGLGMGLLAGNQHFAPRFNILQQQMGRRIEVLYHFSTAPRPRLSIMDISKINEAWKTIKEGWHDDSVLDNFQFHCYFIEQLLQMVTRLSRCLDKPLYNAADTQQSKAETEHITTEQANDQLLLEFVCTRLPKMIEFLGMVRALSTHTATRGFHRPEHNKKLKYVCQCVQSEKRYVIAIADDLHQTIGNTIPSLLALKTYEFKLDAFIEKVTHQVVEQETVSIPSDELFLMATDIMDLYWRIVDDGLDTLHRIQEQQLEQWCLGN